MNIINFFLIICLSIFLFSCQKEVSFEQPDPVINPNPTSSFTGSLLKSYVELTGTDTVRKAFYTYDNTGRLASSYQKFWDNNAPSTEITFYPFYNSVSDSLPNKVSYEEYDIVSSFANSYRQFLSYNNSGKMTRDSLIFTYPGGSDTEVYHYRYFPNFIELTNNYQNILQHSYQTFNAGNLVMERDSITSTYYPPEVLLATCTFDTHPDPFYRTYIKRPIQNIGGEGLLQLYLVAERNNPLHMTGPLPTQLWDYTYTYRPGGYPATVTITSPNFPVCHGVYIYY